MGTSSWAVLIADEVDIVLLNGLRCMGFSVVRQVDKILEDNELISMIPNYEMLIVSDITEVSRAVLEAGRLGGRLRVVINAATETENIDMAAVEEFGVTLIYAPDAHTLSMAEFTCTMLFAMSRNLPQACDATRRLCSAKFCCDMTSEDNLDEFYNQCALNRNFYMGIEVHRKTLGIIGFGRVGQAVARRMSGFGMRIIAFDPKVPLSVFRDFNVEFRELPEVFMQSDFLTLHASLDEHSRQMVNAKSLTLCKRGFCILNCSNEELINENDLVSALNSGICAAAALDRFQEEPSVNMLLLNHPKIIFTPGLSIGTVEAKHKVSFDILEQLKSVIAGEKIGDDGGIPPKRLKSS